LWFFKKEEEEEEGSKALALPSIRVLKIDPRKIALVIYEILGTSPCS
jgi:hypothetical protein